MPSYPAYHTGYETLSLVLEHVDPDLTYHQSCSRLLSVLLYSLSSSSLIQTRFDELAEHLQADYANRGLAAKLRAQISTDSPDPQLNAAIELFESSMKDFSNASTVWNDYLKTSTLNKTSVDPLFLRSLNDISIGVERVFTSSGSTLYGRPDTRNLLIGTPLSDFYTTLFFPGLHDILDHLATSETAKRRHVTNHEELRTIAARIKELTTQLRRHLSEITVAFRVATQMMRPRPI